MNIAIVDDGANLVAFMRMDGAYLGSGLIAQHKAMTSARSGFKFSVIDVNRALDRTSLNSQQRMQVKLRLDRAGLLQSSIVTAG